MNDGTSWCSDGLCAVSVESGVRHCGVEVGEEVIFVRESVERADGFEQSEMFGAWSFDEHSDLTRFEFRDDL
jgi:hypothetical protein